MIGADETDVDRVLNLIRANTRTGVAPSDASAPVPAAATVYAIDLEEYQRLSSPY